MSLTLVVSRVFGILPPTLLTTMSRRPNTSAATLPPTRRSTRVEPEVRDDDVRASPQRPDGFGDDLQLGFGPRGDQDVGAHLGEGHCDGGPSPRPAPVMTATCPSRRNLSRITYWL